MDPFNQFKREVTGFPSLGVDEDREELRGLCPSGQASSPRPRNEGSLGEGSGLATPQMPPLVSSPQPGL